MTGVLRSGKARQSAIMPASPLVLPRGRTTSPPVHSNAPRERARAKGGECYSTPYPGRGSPMPRALRVLSRAAGDDDERAGGMACGWAGIGTGPAVECKIPWSLGERCGSCKGVRMCVLQGWEGYREAGDGVECLQDAVERGLKRGGGHSVGQHGLEVTHGFARACRKHSRPAHQGRSSQNMGKTRHQWEPKISERSAEQDGKAKPGGMACARGGGRWARGTCTRSPSLPRLSPPQRRARIYQRQWGEL